MKALTVPLDPDGPTQLPPEEDTLSSTRQETSLPAALDTRPLSVAFQGDASGATV